MRLRLYAGTRHRPVQVSNNLDDAREVVVEAAVRRLLPQERITELLEQLDDWKCRKLVGEAESQERGLVEPALQFRPVQAGGRRPEAGGRRLEERQALASYLRERTPKTKRKAKWHDSDQSPGKILPMARMLWGSKVYFTARMAAI